MLQTISAHEGVTLTCRERIKAALDNALPPVEAYLVRLNPAPPHSAHECNALRHVSRSLHQRLRRFF